MPPPAERERDGTVAVECKKNPRSPWQTYATSALDLPDGYEPGGEVELDRYAGWKSIKAEATGFFRAEKHKGKWWLVDPEGRLFWSHGIDCVHTHAATPIDDRDGWYRWLPERSDPLFGALFGRQGHVVRG